MSVSSTNITMKFVSDLDTVHTIPFACLGLYFSFSIEPKIFFSSGVRHNIFKIAADPQGDSRVDLQTTLAML